MTTMTRPATCGLRRRPARSLESGVTMVLVAIAMVAIIAIAALSIDLITLYLAKEEAQRAADAAALTAARVISISGITGTADPNNQPTYWQSICGGAASAATLAAQAAGGQNSVGGVGGTVTVTYSTGSGSSNSSPDCSTLSTVFAVNPLVTAQVQRTSLPTFFSRIWGNTGNSISATAVAEVFNPSASDVNTNGGPTGAVTPVQPRCVKPWIVPNQNPFYPTTTCTSPGCNPFVSLSNGSIQNAGISIVGTPGGVIGETFTLFADCGGASGSVPCTPPATDNPPRANVIPGAQLYDGNPAPVGNNLQYLPGEAPALSVAVPLCASAVGYQGAVAGCDQTTQYQCGVQKINAAPPNAIDLSENPGGLGGDTATGLACSLTSQTSPPLSGQDVLDTSAYPFKITAGTANPFKITSGSLITDSTSIVSLPIYDSTGVLTFTSNRAEVTIVGFLQVFIDQINPDGSLQVTVLNVAGCGNGASITPNASITGSSPVPIRLITPP